MAGYSFISTNTYLRATLWKTSQGPLPPSEQTKIIQDTVNDITQSDTLTEKQAKPLNVKLDVVSNQLESGTTLTIIVESGLDSRTIRQITALLGSFKHQIIAYVNGGFLTHENGDLLINLTDNLIETINQN